VLKKYDANTNTTTDVNFIVLDQTEKDAVIFLRDAVRKMQP